MSESFIAPNGDEDASTQSHLLASLRHEVQSVPASGIVEMINYARERADVIPLWAGEGRRPTPNFICQAAEASLKAGETFYTYQRGIPELRQALASYHEQLYGRPFSPERFFVTGSGMQAIQMAVRMVAGPGREVVLPSPAWPNLAAAVSLAGAQAVEVPMQFTPDGWHLDLESLFAKCSERTCAIFVNSPANPTGWTATLDELQAILNFARNNDLWVIADEIYTRFYFGESSDGRVNAPSFYEIASDNDKVLFVNSFSKNWAMTGWRIGWLSCPPILGDVVENLIQYSTSGVATFMQRAAVVALEEGELFITDQIQQAKAGRTKLLERLGQYDELRFAAPKGSFYFFFGLRGVADSMPVAKQIVDEARVGLAPGFAFGQSGSAFMRLCFATNPDQLDLAIERFCRWLNQRQSLADSDGQDAHAS